jgi:transcriptional regulator with XRE-family HTH domain
METLIPAFLRRQRNQRRLTLENLSAKVGMSPQLSMATEISPSGDADENLDLLGGESKRLAMLHRTH